MSLLPVIALVIGLFIPYWLKIGPVEGVSGYYLAVACLAGLDTVTGGIRSGMEGTFRSDIFFSGFLSNIVIAFFLAWLGDRIGLNLYLVAALVLGARVFTNLSLIRRILLTRLQDSRAKQARQREVQNQAQGTTTSGSTTGGS